MKRKKNLAEALQSETAKPKKALQPKNINRGLNNLPPSRQGKKALTVYLDPDVIKQVKLIGIEAEMSNQDMLREALNDFFIKHSKAQIA